jgi:phosphoribosyl 1,2-cyclic phosphodiesterase
VIDAGTGIVPLGEALDPEIAEVIVLLSHRHMDHVQGLPFFAPLYESAPPVALLDLPVEEGWWSPLELFDGVAVPMRPDRLGAAARRVEGDPLEALRRRGWEVERLDLRHPGGSAGFLVREGGHAFAHLTDTDLGGASEDTEFFRRCADFCRGVDVLSHDAQYRATEMPTRRGRGHSSVERVCDLAEAARVGRLILFHHDPGRDDAALDGIGRWAAERLAGEGIECVVAREGLEVEVGGGG